MNDLPQVAKSASHPDVMAERLTLLEARLTATDARLKLAESTLKRMLDVFTKSEQTFQTRVFSTLGQFFGNMAHQMQHAITDPHGSFKIERVDGTTVKENEMSLVIRRTESGYDFAMASEPEAIKNDGTEALVAYLDEHPEVFGEDSEIVANVSVATHLLKETPDEQPK